VHEYKSGCIANGGRLSVLWRKNGTTPFYQIMRDEVNNCTTTPPPPSWVVEWRPTLGENCPPFPVGEWFYDEFYVSYPNSLSGGFVKYAINGNMVFDQVPPSGDPLPPVPNRVKITPGTSTSRTRRSRRTTRRCWLHPRAAASPADRPLIAEGRRLARVARQYGRRGAALQSGRA
jgi:hypothetical protein